MGTVKRAADAPIALAGEAGVLETSLGGLNTPACKRKGANGRLHRRKLGAEVDLRSDAAGHYVLDVANFVRKMPRRPSLEGNVCMMSQRTVSGRGIAVRARSGVQPLLWGRVLVHGAQRLSRMQGGHDERSH